LKRVRYFPGQLLTADDFRDEQVVLRVKAGASPQLVVVSYN